MSREFSYQEVAEHNTKKDIYVVIGDKIYDVTKFVDEHPGGEEVLLDVGGQDATEAFEDVGHSDEARETLEKLEVGTLVRKPGDPVPKTASYGTSGSSAAGQSGGGGMGVTMYLVVLVGGLAAYGAYLYMQQSQQPAPAPA